MKHTIIITASICLLAACGSNKEAAKPASPEEIKTSIHLSNELLQRSEVIFGKAEKRHLRETISANGMIDVPPQNLASVSTPMAGYVTYTNILPGSYVTKGQVLAVLEHQGYLELQQQYLQSLSRLSLTEKEFERQKELGVENVSSAKRVQQSESDFKTELALSNSLAEKLKLIGINPSAVAEGKITPKISVRAPIKGFVKTANVSIGKFISPEMLIFEIVDVEHMHVELKVFEKDVLKIKKGQKIYFTVPTLDSTTVEAKVVLLGKTFDNTTRTVGVHGHFDEKKYNFLLPGMYVNANVIVDERDAFTLPESAIVRTGDKFAVFAKKSSDGEGATLETVFITLGIKENGNVEILSPANIQNKDLVLTGAYFIQSEMSKTEEE